MIYTYNYTTVFKELYLTVCIKTWSGIQKRLANCHENVA